MINTIKFRLWVLLVPVSAILLYGFWVEPNQVVVKEIWVKDSGLAMRLRGLTVVHLSDLHIGEIGKREKRALRILDELKPDFIFLTGDYVQWGGDYEAALTFLSMLKARIGVWAVMGDYDYSNSRKSCLFCHEPGSAKSSQRHNVTFLRNRSARVDMPGGPLWICGITGENYGEKTPAVMGADWEPTIVLSHSPENFDLLDGRRDVLMLAGDTHGGQIALPVFFWKLIGYEKNVRYGERLYVKGKGRMVVNRGVGTSHVPIRILRPPEVVVLRFGEH